ncbi:hypothetical protein CKF54_03690 [Psittacicella hinzii]|uniref:Uncharacterized protein n=1 Tax=Psittacicella hinzii TaxID=2028575 RepID=A0A3A1Y9V2_9GAMM|nr:hypothetical protein [Psittacicella hinzii]RIY32914.1 hypothetical protein CKF54_03690 [Psittacicella hinzii]
MDIKDLYRSYPDYSIEEQEKYIALIINTMQNNLDTLKYLIANHFELFKTDEYLSLEVLAKYQADIAENFDYKIDLLMKASEDFSEFERNFKVEKGVLTYKKTEKN